MSDFSVISVGKVNVYRAGKAMSSLCIEHVDCDEVICVPMDDVIPFVKAVFSAATGREFTGEETRWGTPDRGGADDE